MDSREILVLQQRAVADLAARIAAESYLKVADVMKRMNLSRQTVESLPLEVLPFVDCSTTPGRVMRRYHPADVVAADARIRGWRRAQQKHEGEAYLNSLRAELDARDNLARETAIAAARVA